MSFLDKRDKDGQLLGFSIYPLQYYISDICFTNFQKSNTYKILSSDLDKSLIDIYFKKIFYELSLKLVCKILLSENNSSANNKIESSFPLLNYLKKDTRFKNLILIKKKNYDSLKEKLKNFIWKKSNFIYYLFFGYIDLSKNKSKKNKIAVNFLEGCSYEKRNDFFWFSNKQFNSGEVATYVEHSNNFKKFGTKREQIKKLKEKGIEIINYKKIKYFKPRKNFTNILCKLKKNKTYSEEEKWIKNHSLILISRIQFWYNFFKDEKIKIHFNSEELEGSNVIRQIAIKLNNGCSIGKIKSLPTNMYGDFIGFYPNDVFFVWGKDSGSRIKKTFNPIKNILISGDPYPAPTAKNDQSFKTKIDFLKTKNIKFIIMLLDSSFSDNKEVHWQLMHSKKMENFFTKFFEYVRKNNEVGLIVKSKRKDNLKSLPMVYSSILELVKLNKCLFINEFSEISSHYSKYADITVSAGAFISGSLIQCAINNRKNRAVMFDDTNIEKYEKKIYEQNFNKKIFKDIEKLIKEIDNLKNINNSNEIGLWKDLEDYDPFGDCNGGERIGNFVRELLNKVNSGGEIDESIIKCVNSYKNKFGMDKEVYV